MDEADRFVRLRLLTGRHFTPVSLVFAGTFICEKRLLGRFQLFDIISFSVLFTSRGPIHGHDSVALLPKKLMTLFAIAKSFVLLFCLFCSFVFFFFFRKKRQLILER